MHKLLLTITDASMLEKGTLPYCYFDFAGGLVGSAPNVSWKVNNWKNEISGIEIYFQQRKPYGLSSSCP